jgi:hypothetical protein
MNKTNRNIRLAFGLPLVAGIIGLTPVVVYAQQGSDDSGSSSGRGGSSLRTTSVKTATETESNDDPATHDVADDRGDDAVKSQASQLLSEKRQNGKQHSAEQKKKSCEVRAANINRKADKYAAQAQKHLDVFNKIFTKVQNFHDDKNLNVDGYDALLATATAKQTDAQTAVDALKAVDVDIDCTQSDPASAVATLKAATKNARSALHEYRTAIKDLVVAMKGASTAQSSDDSSSDDTGTDTTTDTTNTGGAQ